MEGTAAQRTAALGLMILGGLNALAGLIALVSNGHLVLYGGTLLAGLLLLGLGWFVGQGSRPATLAVLGLLGLLALSQAAIFVTTGNLQSLGVLLVAGLLGWLTFRALRGT